MKAPWQQHFREKMPLLTRCSFAINPDTCNPCRGGMQATGNNDGSAIGAPATDWPVYRHDVALSGVSPGKGRIEGVNLALELP